MSLAKRSVDGETLILKKFRPDFPPVVGNLTKMSLLFLDLETTGLSHDKDEIIELGYRGVELYVDGTYGCREGVSTYNEPKQLIEPKITALTGITQEHVKGHKIDWARFEQEANTVDAIVAHNASFDRPFIDVACPALRTKPWMCTKSQVDWISHGLPNKLELLGVYMGVFTDAHRALEDVDLMIWTLLQENSKYLKELITTAQQEKFRVEMLTEYSEAEMIKSRGGYKWNPASKFWWKLANDAAEADEELEWARACLNRGPQCRAKKLFMGEQFARF